MLAPLWLAVAGLPVFLQPLPQAADQPAAVAIANGSADLRRPCLRLQCAAYEWEPPSPATTIAYRDHPAPTSAALLPGAGRGFGAPWNNRRWSSNYFSDLGVGTTYGVTAWQTPATSVQVEIGPALRIQPYVDDGTARAGPVARGQIQLSQKLGDRAQLTQSTRFETGLANTFVRNSLGVDVFLHPQWVLDSDIETVHDSVAGGKGVTNTQGTVNLRHTF